MREYVPEQVLADAVRYLFESKEPDLARSLLECNLLISRSGTSNRLILKCPESALYNALTQLPKSYLRSQVENALRVALGPSQVLAELDVRYATIELRKRAIVQTLLTLAQSGTLSLLPIQGPQVTLDGTVVSLHPISLYSMGAFKRKKRTGFVAMPFLDEFRMVYEDGIRPAVHDMNLNCFRADETLRTGDIVQHIWRSLVEARFVIADITPAGSGNVLYEVGMAHVIGHDVILMTQDIHSVPFNLTRLSVIEYSPRNIRALRGHLCSALQSYVV